MLGVLSLTGCSEPQPAGPASRSAESFTGIVDELLRRLDGSAAQLLCLGEAHGAPADAELRTALVRHPEFPRRVRSVVFEGASALHQERLDAYVLGGAEMDRRQLAAIWQDAGRGVQWRLPIYERLLQDLQTLNRGLPPGERVRLLGGSPPIPRDVVRHPEDLVPWLDRRAWQHDLLRAEVVQAGRTTLAVFGRHHCERPRFEDAPALAARLVAALPVDPGSETAVRRRLGLTGDAPAGVPLDGPHGRLAARDTWSEAHLFAGRRFEELADVLISYGARAVAPRVVDEDALPAAERAELHRRDALWAAALRNREEQARSRDAIFPNG